MKLAIARQRYTPYGGAERFVERALTALRAQGTDVTIIAREWLGEPGPGFLQCNPFYLGRTWRDASFAACVRRVIAEGRFDLVQSHERIPGCHIYRAGDGVHATWLELRKRARRGMGGIASYLPLAPWHRYTLAAEAVMFEHPDLKAVICNSVMVRDDIAKRFRIAADKLHVIYNGVDLERFHPGLRGEHRAPLRAQLGIGEAVPVILFVGSGFERKGVATLLQALARMERRDAILLVVGRDRQEKRMRWLAAKLGLAQRVHFLGGQEDVRPLYGVADCFALPTLYDPMPNAALEALACGLPVVTTTTSGAAELLKAAASGSVVDALDVTALARELDAVLAGAHDPAAAATIRASVEHLGLGAMAARLGELYRRLTPAGRL